MTGAWRGVLATLALAGTGWVCIAPPPHARISLADPSGIATDATAVSIGLSPTAMTARGLRGRPLPLSVTLTAAKGGEQLVFAEARDIRGRVLARGSGPVLFTRKESGTTTVTLQTACDSGFPDGTRCTVEEDGESEGICLQGSCVLSRCGDGFIDRTAGEPCDDGNTADDDACLQIAVGTEVRCEAARCGDAHVWAGVEVCDDGNTDDADGCRGDCAKLEVCGDRVKDPQEDCDDGNTNPEDGCDACALVSYALSPLVGALQLGDATDLWLDQPVGVAVTRDGTLYVSDARESRVFRFSELTGSLTVAVGGAGGEWGYAGDGGPAALALFAQPAALAVDAFGSLFIGDFYSRRIRRVDAASSIVSTYAGNGMETPIDDGIDSRVAALGNPRGLVVDRQGNLFYADSSRHVVRRVDAQTHLVRTIAGQHGVLGSDGDGGPAVDALLGTPWGIAIDERDNIFIADSYNSRIRRIDAATGLIDTIAGTVSGNSSGDGGPATDAVIRAPRGLALDGHLLYVAESADCLIRRIDLSTGIIDTVVGDGTRGGGGDGGDARAAQLDGPEAIAVGPGGILFIADAGNRRVRRFDPTTRRITTVLGGGRRRGRGDGGRATSAELHQAWGLHVDANGTLWFSDVSEHRIRRVDPATGIIDTVVGTGEAGPSEEGVAASDSAVDSPAAVTLDAGGNLYFCDTGNNRVRRVDATTGTVTTVAGNGFRGNIGDDGLATEARIGGPRGVAIDALDNLFIAQQWGSVIRRVDAVSRIITTVAGTGAPGYDGTETQATLSPLDEPSAVLVEPGGTLLVADTRNHRVRRVDIVADLIEPVAGTGVAGASGDGDLATLASIREPTGLARDADGNIYIATDLSLRRVDAVTGFISTVAGRSNAGSGLFEGRPATSVSMRGVRDVAIGSDGMIYLSASQLFGFSHVHRIDPADDLLFTVAGELHPRGDGPFGAGFVLGAERLLALPDSSVLVSDSISGTLRRLDLSAQTVRSVVGIPQGFSDDDSSGPLSRLLGEPVGLAFDPATSTAYVAERANHTIRSIVITDPSRPETWTVRHYAGQIGTAGYADGSLADARFASPSGLAFVSDVGGTGSQLYVADTGNHLIRAISIGAGTVDTLAGAPRQKGFFGEGDPARDALLNGPRALAVAPSTPRHLYVADTDNHRVRRIDLVDGTIDTVLGDGVPATSGSGAPARLFPVASPQGLHVDIFGNLFVTSPSVVRRVAAGNDDVAGGEDVVAVMYGAAIGNSRGSAVSCLTGVGANPRAPGELLLLERCQGFVARLGRSSAR